MFSAFTEMRSHDFNGFEKNADRARALQFLKPHKYEALKGFISD